MKHFVYRTSGTCSSKIEFDLDGDIVRNVCFTGGCNGNLKAIPRLIEGISATEVINRVKGVTCGPRGTSCADQLSRALEQALSQAD
ncbi:MAG: TIGR03905 family TSCPD domain-containing protein [Ruminococcaceae bacterium]|nr:TIGR03905 family TSCPD domain-containing protein [Oscillospiraceae bacterium]